MYEEFEYGDTAKVINEDSRYYGMTGEVVSECTWEFKIQLIINGRFADFNKDELEKI